MINLEFASFFKRAFWELKYRSFCSWQKLVFLIQHWRSSSKRSKRVDVFINYHQIINLLGFYGLSYLYFCLYPAAYLSILSSHNYYMAMLWIFDFYWEMHTIILDTLFPSGSWVLIFSLRKQNSSCRSLVSLRERRCCQA